MYRLSIDMLFSLLVFYLVGEPAKISVDRRSYLQHLMCAWGDEDQSFLLAEAELLFKTAHWDEMK